MLVESGIGFRRQSAKPFRCVPATSYSGINVDEVPRGGAVVEGVHLARHHVIGVQDRTDLHLDGRLSAPVRDKLDPMLMLQVTGLTDVQPGECLQAKIDRNVESLVLEGSDDRIDSGRKVGTSLPVGEEVNVLTRPVDDAVRRDRMPSGKANPNGPPARRPILASTRCSGSAS